MLPGAPDLGGLLAVLGLGFLAVVLQQMLRRPRDELVASLSGGVLLLCRGVRAGRAAAGRAASADGPAAVDAAVLAVGCRARRGPPGRPGAARARSWPRTCRAALARPRCSPCSPAPAVAWVRGRRLAAWARCAGRSRPCIFGAVLGGGPRSPALAASYVVVEATAVDDGGADPPRPLGAAAVVQAVVPLAACAPVALALQTVL